MNGWNPDTDYYTDINGLDKEMTELEKRLNHARGVRDRLKAENAKRLEWIKSQEDRVKAFYSEYYALLKKYNVYIDSTGYEGEQGLFDVDNNQKITDSDYDWALEKRPEKDGDNNG